MGLTALGANLGIAVSTSVDAAARRVRLSVPNARYTFIQPDVDRSATAANGPGHLGRLKTASGPRACGAE